MKKLLLIACIVAFTAVSCKKDNTDSTSSNTVCTTAKIHYGGDPLADGTGWVLVTDSIAGVYEVPENLDMGYKTEGLLVDVCYYKSLNDFVCSCSPPKKKVHITSIKNH